MVIKRREAQARLWESLCLATLPADPTLIPPTRFATKSLCASMLGEARGYSVTLGGRRCQDALASLPEHRPWAHPAPGGGSRFAGDLLMRISIRKCSKHTSFERSKVER